MKLLSLSSLLSLVALLSCNSPLRPPSSTAVFHTPLESTQDGPAAGNPGANAAIPADAAAEGISNPDVIVGTGTPASCTAEAFIAAVAHGGVITFNSGGLPVTIVLDRPAQIYNDSSALVVIDGGGLVTLSGGGRTRILYMNTCDPDLHWTTDHCDNQEFPQLSLQNLILADGNATAETEYEGGGAVWVRGGRVKMSGCRFYNNRCTASGADLGGGAVRVTSQYNNLPVNIVNCTFGGAEGYGNQGSNGGALSSIGVSWSIYNSLFSFNSAVGNGGNPATAGTVGGGSGGAIYNDGNTMSLALFDTRIEDNTVNAFGGAVFFVSNDHTGDVLIDNCVLRRNTGGSWYPQYPGISAHDDTRITVVGSVIE